MLTTCHAIWCSIVLLAVSGIFSGGCVVASGRLFIHARLTNKKANAALDRALALEANSTTTNERTARAHVQAEWLLREMISTSEGLALRLAAEQDRHR